MELVLWLEVQWFMLVRYGGILRFSGRAPMGFLDFWKICLVDLWVLLCFLGFAVGCRGPRIIIEFL